MSVSERATGGSRVTAPSQREGAAARRRRGAQIGPSFGSALTALWANRLRSLLTALGVVVGVGAVIAVVTLTQGTAALINSRVAGLGTNTLVITPGASTTGGAAGGLGTQQTLKEQDATALASLPHVVNESPVINVNAQVIAGGLNWATRIQGVMPNFQQIQTWSLSEGAWYTDSDESASLPVAVIGQTVADNLFTPVGADPVGQTILIRNQAFRVVGVLQSKGSAGFTNQDDVVFVPFSVAVARLDNITYVNQIQVQVDNADNVAGVQQAITDLLEQRHRLPAGGPDDFLVRSPTQFVATAQQFEQTLTLLLVGVAAISLLVGGIGIMNIMLVSVTERVREIGIRMAVGARRGDIRNQFLIEAVSLSSLGGLIGIGLGLLGGFVLTHAFQLDFVLNPMPILLAFGVAATVGILFGFYPALRASRLDPIVALRTE